MGVYEKYGKGQKEEQQGIWQEVGDGIKFKIACAGGRNYEFVRAYQKYMSPIQKDIKDGKEIDLLILQEAKANLIVDSILKGWEGINFTKDMFYGTEFESWDFKEGEPIHFTYDNALKIIKHIPNMSDDIEKISGNLELFFSKDSRTAQNT